MGVFPQDLGTATPSRSSCGCKDDNYTLMGDIGIWLKMAGGRYLGWIGGIWKTGENELLAIGKEQVALIGDWILQQFEEGRMLYQHCSF